MKIAGLKQLADGVKVKYMNNLETENWPSDSRPNLCTNQCINIYMNWHNIECKSSLGYIDQKKKLYAKKKKEKQWIKSEK